MKRLFIFLFGIAAVVFFFNKKAAQTVDGLRDGKDMQKIKIVDTDHVFQTDELRSHYMSLIVYLLVAIMKNEQTEEVLFSVRLIHPHLPMVKKLFKIVDADGSDISEQIYSHIDNIHTEAVSSGLLV